MIVIAHDEFESDELLWSRFCTIRCKASFSQLVCRYDDVIQKFLERRFRFDQSTADDIRQKLWLKLFRTPRDNCENFRALIFSEARGDAIDEKRGGARRVETLADNRLDALPAKRRYSPNGFEPVDRVSDGPLDGLL